MDVGRKCYTYKIICHTKAGTINEYLTDNSDIAIEHIAVLITDYKNSKVEILRGCFYVI